MIFEHVATVTIKNVLKLFVKRQFMGIEHAIIALAAIVRSLTVKKIEQKNTNQDRTKIGPFFDFLQQFLIL